MDALCVLGVLDGLCILGTLHSWRCLRSYPGVCETRIQLVRETVPRTQMNAMMPIFLPGSVVLYTWLYGGIYQTRLAPTSVSFEPAFPALELS